HLIILENFPALTQNFLFEKNRCDDFLLFLNQAVFEKKNIYLYVCGEAVYEPQNFECIKRFQELLNAQVVCSVNGAFACVDLPNFYGHVGIGGHPDINHRWKNLGANDVLIILGADFGDYHFLSSMSEVSSAWILSNLYQAYGFINESYQHRFAHPLHLLKGPIHQTLSYLIQYPISKSTILAKGDFEKFKPQTVASEKVNLLEFYQKINKLWKKQTLCFEDVCTAYRDRQYVLPIPNKNVQFFSSQDGSAMGGALGIGVGAKLAAPQKHCFIFMGDGCSRLVFGALSELAHLGIVIFILNNQSFGIVDDVYQKIYSHIDHKKHHVKLAAVDFVGLAKACFWDAEKLKPDLSNLESLIDKAYSTKRSLLIEIPCESFQSLGFNPRKLILK
ncbi:MAG TPA: hypothetical protein DCZ80_07625, partial [Legionellales bacterium]|nr:hypothetical protein [Legionellales bacterium]